MTSPGFYHYYETTRTTWNTTFARVVADQRSEHFPLAMDGVLWVQGFVGQLPQAAINHVVHGHDDFAAEFLAIRAGGTVTWHNFDEDAHFLGIVAGWSPPINPFDFGLYRIAGSNDVPGGEGVTIVFNMPGLYYYYCRNHDIINVNTTRVEALPKASEYPIPMEGFVLVNSD
jgi:plastocyanin